MSSSIHYRFKSQKEYSRISFDAAQMGLTVFDIKRDIIQLEKLGTGADFDLVILNADSNKEYSDDAENVPRGTSILVQRKPPSRGPGKGSASRYVTTNTIQISSRQEFKKPIANSVVPNRVSLPPLPSSGTPEDEAIRNMLAASSDHWQETSDRMALSKPVYRPGNKGMPSGPVPDRPLPQGYICYRCGQKGHYIQACPTNGDESFENRKRIKRTTGIPRSQLQKVENPGEDADGNVMVNADGESVMFVPDAAAWNSYQQTTKSSKQIENPDDPELVCELCKTLMQEPHGVPCCDKVFCEECIQGFLLESDFICPCCGTKDVLLDQLRPMPELQKKIQGYTQQKEEGKAKAEEVADQSAAQVSEATNSTSLKRSLDDVIASDTTTNLISNTGLPSNTNLPPGMPPFDPMMMSMMGGFPPLGFPPMPMPMPLPNFGFPPMMPMMPMPPMPMPMPPSRNTSQYKPSGPRSSGSPNSKQAGKPT